MTHCFLFLHTISWRHYINISKYMHNYNSIQNLFINLQKVFVCFGCYEKAQFQQCFKKYSLGYLFKMREPGSQLRSKLRSEEMDSRGGTWNSVCFAIIYSEAYPSSAHNEPKIFNLKNETLYHFWFLRTWTICTVHVIKMQMQQVPTTPDHPQLW